MLRRTATFSMCNLHRVSLVDHPTVLTLHGGRMIPSSANFTGTIRARTTFQLLHDRLGRRSLPHDFHIPHERHSYPRRSRRRLGITQVLLSRKMAAIPIAAARLAIMRRCKAAGICTWFPSRTTCSRTTNSGGLKESPSPVTDGTKSPTTSGFLAIQSRKIRDPDLRRNPRPSTQNPRPRVASPRWPATHPGRCYTAARSFLPGGVYAIQNHVDMP